MARILLLDDDRDTLAWMVAALETRGHDVVGFSSGREALEIVPSFRPELIVADILMPEMDGLAFARLVRAFDVPVMFVSLAKREAEAILAGAAGFLRKPATAEEVRAAVDDVLGHKDARRTILLVDDDLDVRELYRFFLEDRFDVLTAENGAVALDVLRTSHVDLAIVDVHMPVMNGADLVRAIRADPELEALPIVVQTNDPVALDAPLWATLRVSKVMDKSEFAGWFERQIEAAPASFATGPRAGRPDAGLSR